MTLRQHWLVNCFSRVLYINTCLFQIVLHYIDNNDDNDDLILVLLVEVGNYPRPLTSTELWNCQRSSNELSWRLLNMFGRQKAMLIDSTPPSKNPIQRHKNRKYPSRLLSFVAHIIPRVLGHTVTTFPWLYPYFRGPAVQWCCQRCHQKSHYTRNRHVGRPNQK